MVELTQNQKEYLRYIGFMSWRELLTEMSAQAGMEQYWEQGACEGVLVSRISMMEDELAAFHTLHGMKAVENG